MDVLLIWLGGLITWWLVSWFVVCMFRFAVVVVGLLFWCAWVVGLLVGFGLGLFRLVWGGGLVWCLGCLVCIYFAAVCFEICVYWLIWVCCLGSGLVLLLVWFVLLLIAVCVVECLAVAVF